jgi:hypothetical protein
VSSEYHQALDTILRLGAEDYVDGIMRRALQSMQRLQQAAKAPEAWDGGNGPSNSRRPPCTKTHSNSHGQRAPAVALDVLLALHVLYRLKR